MQTFGAKSFAKINTFLGVGTKLLPSGKHRVDSVMFPVAIADDILVYVQDADDQAPLCDSLGTPFAFAEDPSVDIHMRFEASDEALPKLQDNTVYKAAHCILKYVTAKVRLAFEIVKRSPSGMGLGASSANAAKVLELLFERLPHSTDLTFEDLFSIARSIGADVPFFLEACPAYFDEAGDRLAERFEARTIDVVVVCPKQSNATSGMYAAFDAHPVPAEDVSAQLSLLRQKDFSLSEFAKSLHNNLQEVALADNLLAQEALLWLSAQEGVVAAQVTGSGAASFALCKDASSAKRIGEQAKNMNLLAFVTHTGAQES